MAISTILSFFICLSLFSASVSIQKPTKLAPEGFVTDLLRRINPRAQSSLPFDGSHFLKPLIRHQGHGKCYAKFNPKRAVTLASDYYGLYENSLYVDRRHDLLRYAFGFNKSGIAESKKIALKHIKDQFGISFDPNAKVNKTTGLQEDPKTNLVFAPVVFNAPLRLIADSKNAISCADTPIVHGGWLMWGQNVTLSISGRVHPKEPVVYKGDIYFLTWYVAFLPGTKYVTRIVSYPIYPGTCTQYAACPFSGAVFNLEEPSDDFTAWVDGIIVQYFFEGPEITELIRVSIVDPGRFVRTPGTD